MRSSTHLGSFDSMEHANNATPPSPHEPSGPPAPSRAPESTSAATNEATNEPSISAVASLLAAEAIGAAAAAPTGGATPPERLPEAERSRSNTPSQFADIGRVKTLRRSLRGYELEPAELASENSFHYKAEYVELVFETS